MKCSFSKGIEVCSKETQCFVILQTVFIKASGVLQDKKNDFFVIMLSFSTLHVAHINHQRPLSGKCHFARDAVCLKFFKIKQELRWQPSTLCY